MPLAYNPQLQSAATLPQETVPMLKKKRAALPFIDDFSYAGPYPDPARWVDRQAYVNNTLSNSQITRGMASLDGLNQYGRPYYPGQFSSGLADSLTSVEIDLSTYTTANSIYLSFFYQPQGLGFAPETDDSLFLYFRNSSNQWVRMWQTWGTPWQPFKSQVIPVTDPQFLHSAFQFRFSNIASLNLNNDIWNLDYVKMDVNRNMADTVMNDLAFTIEPGSILSPYSAMPYRHFTANQANEKSAQQLFEVRNTGGSSQTLSAFHTAREVASATPVSSFTVTPTTVGAKSSLSQAVPSYSITYTAPGPQSEVIIRNTYYFTSPGGSDRRDNDTIVRDAVFGNYFAYDDGSAEKAYFLYPAFNFPSKTALQFTLNQSDTVRGLSAFFAAQAPTAAGKYFSIVLYKQLAGGGFTDSIIRQEDLYQVKYDTLLNGFVNYAFSSPVVLTAGTYYMGITQPANFGSDSVYYGLDVNNNTSSQHLYYNVDGTWYASSVAGSVMMRPIVGPFFTPTQIGQLHLPESAISVNLWPNPVRDRLFVQCEETLGTYRIFRSDGYAISSGILSDPWIDVSTWAPGFYLMEVQTASGKSGLTKFFKQ